MQVRRDTAALSHHPVFDVIVAGGGATGLGIAWDAITRGYSVLLLEKHDFCKGTSSRSTKLVHGGVRYLAQGKVGLVREALKERTRILHNVPGITGALAFVIPVYHRWQLPFYGLGLTLYDVLAGARGIGHTRWLSKTAVLDILPGVCEKGLVGGIQYMDGHFDDARLGIAMARDISARGGIVYNYMPVTGLLKRTDGKISGIVCRDSLSGEEFEVQGKTVINATGVFTDEVRKMDDKGIHHTVKPSQGTHIVLDRKFLSSDAALMIPKTADGRVLFAIPWHGKLLAGTTDVAVEHITDEPYPSVAEVDFILETAAGYLAEKPSGQDILSVFAGLRPLAVEDGNRQRTGDISREHHISVSASGLVSITGGKWTTFRKMAEDCLDQAILHNRLFPRPCCTYDLPFSAGRIQGEGTYVHLSLPYTFADMEYAACHEWCYRLEDLLVRRTRCLMIDVKATLEILPLAAGIMQQVHGWTENEKEKEMADFRELARHYLPGGIQEK